MYMLDMLVNNSICAKSLRCVWNKRDKDQRGAKSLRVCLEQERSIKERSCKGK